MTNRMNNCTHKELRDNKKLHDKYKKVRYLSKPLSKSIIINVCPYCEYCYSYKENLYDDDNNEESNVKTAMTCDSFITDDGYKYCKLKSSPIDSVWISILDDRPKIVIGKTYGKITPIKYKYKDNYGNLYYECIVNDNENTKLIRSDNILSGTRIYRVRENKKYNIGSQNNPDGTKHVYPSEHHTKVGQAVDELVIEEKESENGPITLKYHRKTLCDECKGIVRINQHGEAECERCHLIC